MYLGTVVSDERACEGDAVDDLLVVCDIAQLHRVDLICSYGTLSAAARWRQTQARSWRLGADRHHNTIKEEGEGGFDIV
jgi:hypothetical protein